MSDVIDIIAGIVCLIAAVALPAVGFWVGRGSAPSYSPPPIAAGSETAAINLSPLGNGKNDTPRIEWALGNPYDLPVRLIGPGVYMFCTTIRLPPHGILDFHGALFDQSCAGASPSAVLLIEHSDESDK